nr:MAG TPA: hypothetical protein [Caudoviricetes sp.]
MLYFTVLYQRNTNIIRFCRYYILFKPEHNRQRNVLWNRSN